MSIFIRAYCCTIFPTFLLIMAVSLMVPIGFAALIALTLLANAALSLAVSLFADKIGSLATFLYRGGSVLTKTQQYAANLDQARYYKRSGQYEKALSVINEYLDKAARTSEALHLKAQILWFGFKDDARSKECLQEVLNNTSRQDNYHNWSMDLYKIIG